MSTTSPTTRRASSRRRLPSPLPPINPNPPSPILPNLNPEEGESGEEELAQSYHEADMARANITPPNQEPSIMETI